MSAEQITDENFFAPCICFALFAFLNIILVHAVSACGLANFLLQTSTTAKTKSCSFSNNKCRCSWAFVFKVSRKLKSKESNLFLDLFTWSVIFYNVDFLWWIFLVAQKILWSINIVCYIFLVFPFWCLDQDSHPIVNEKVSVVLFATSRRLC